MNNEEYYDEMRNEELDKKNSEVIDLRDIFKKLKNHKSLFLKVWLITFILSCLFIFPVPRTYTAETSVAPESNDVDGSSLSSIASSFGFNIGDMATNDAFYPDIYPDVMASNDFIVDLMNVKVKSIDGEIDTDYFDYLKNHQKKTFYMVPFRWIGRQAKKLFGPKPVINKGKNTGIDPFMLSEQESMLFEYVRNNITCSVDKKTGIITISVSDQDPLICACLADSARVHLQNFITEYRTNKARIDYEYYSRLVEEAKGEYDDAIIAYGRYCDSHMNTILETVNSRRDELENDLSMKLNTYNTMNTQLVAAKAKVQECTPAFSVLQSPTVPVKATSPKRMIFIIAMLFFATIGVITYIFKKDVLDNIFKVK